MNVKELKAFRAKLVKAAEISSEARYDWLQPSLRAAGFSEAGELANQVSGWYFHDKRTDQQRKAMWDNSIAYIDAQIAKGK